MDIGNNWEVLEIGSVLESGVGSEGEVWGATALLECGVGKSSVKLDGS